MNPASLKLSTHPDLNKPAGPVVLVVVDGVGVGRKDDFDAFHLARTSVLDRLYSQGAYRTLLAHGTAVGLPTDGDLGGSEVGHNVMGAGRIVDQGPKLVDNAFADESVFSSTWAEMVARVKSGNGALHLVGLLSDGNIHSNNVHLYRMIDRAVADAVPKLRVHALLDGRDVPDKSAHEYLDDLEHHLNAAAQGMDYRIASVGGRMVSIMDRYNADWRMVETGWNHMVHGLGERFATASAGLSARRAAHADLSDQYVEPFLVTDDNSDVACVEDGDAVIMFNFRGDRAIELCEAFEAGDDFDRFDRGRVPDVLFAGMMLYDGDLGIPSRYLVKPPRTEGCMSEYLAANGIHQFACAETQKFGHVTYFWNGNRSGMFDENLERYVEIPSDVVPFEQRPWMKAAETADAIIEAVNDGTYGFLRANFAGGDMVGHSGRMEPTIIALEAIDISIARVADCVEQAGGCLVLTADHGNAEDMVERDKAGVPLMDEEGRPRRRTAHSLNPVPFCIIDYSGREIRLARGLEQAGLGNIAPTLFELMGFEPPADYAPSLLETA